MISFIKTLGQLEFVGNDAAEVSVKGGIAVGELGTGLYNGYKLAWLEEFKALDVLAPLNSRGEYFGTRNYSDPAGYPRGNDSNLGTMYDTDPYFTGYNDSNRGVAVGYDNMRVSGGNVVLQARKASAGEKLHMSSSRNEVSSMLDGVGSAIWYPGTAGSQDIIVESKITFSAAADNPAGSHMTWWLLSLNLGDSAEADEIDVEGNSANAYLMRALHSVAIGGIQYTAGTTPHPRDGLPHLYTLLLNKTRIILYIDGVEHERHTVSANAVNKPQHNIWSNHILNEVWDGENYSPTAWNNKLNGASMTLHYARCWIRTAKQWFTPLVAQADVNVNYGSSVNIVLPSKLILWGDSGVTEHVTAMFHEENEPGVTHTTAYDQFPTGVSYNTGTRTLTVNITSGKSGRINFAAYAWKADGSGGEPLRFAVNVGPNLASVPASLSYTVGDVVNVDLYPLVDCGVLTPNMTISYPDLAGSGLSVVNKRLVGTATEVSKNVTFTCVNSAGQTRTKTQALAVAAPPAGFAYQSWSGLVGWFDASDPACITVNGSNQVTGMVNKVVGAGDLTGGGTIANRTRVANQQNSLAVVRVVRDVSSSAAVIRMTALVNSLLSQAQQGNDKPFTVVIGFKPTDANTRFPWSWSDTTGTSSIGVESIAPVSRSTSTQTVRRVTNNVGTVGQNVDYTNTHASGVARILAYRFTGTTLDVFDNSLTRIVTGAAQNANSFSANLKFGLFYSEVEGTTDPQYALTQGNMDFWEIAVADNAKSVAEIQQAMTDFATKWGHTLT